MKTLIPTFFLLLGFLLAAVAEEALPKAAQDLLDKRQEAVDRIDERLNEELEKVKVRCVKEGDLEGALRIDALIQESDKSVTSDATDPLVGSIWDFLGVNRQKINEFVFLKGGKVKCANSYKDAIWKRLNENTILFGYTSNGGYIVMVADESGKMMSGRNQEGRPRSLKRIK